MKIEECRLVKRENSLIKNDLDGRRFVRLEAFYGKF